LFLRHLVRELAEIPPRVYHRRAPDVAQLRLHHLLFELDPSLSLLCVYCARVPVVELIVAVLVFVFVLLILFVFLFVVVEPAA
jgi:hypothetical protein